ncbi:hypothetical protein D8674_027527 [Pyrus ussuriensis x Pyrus communis]|uniref:Uncharacterized protein n=1 Tax=Pyrus ussuriensis x Pyrus communis TaxID=2448454 RepID=A0A5N5ICZ7_9ROSA|nr:hypothetical protein D8674_027527 [Pyrus ussuriensis x Pyrus communis]
MGFGPLGTSCAPALNIFSFHGNGCLPRRTRNPSPLLPFESMMPCEDLLVAYSSITFFLPMTPTPCDLEEVPLTGGIGKLCFFLAMVI